MKNIIVLFLLPHVAAKRIKSGGLLVFFLSFQILSLYFFATQTCVLSAAYKTFDHTHGYCGVHLGHRAHMTTPGSIERCLTQLPAAPAAL